MASPHIRTQFHDDQWGGGGRRPVLTQGDVGCRGLVDSEVVSIDIRWWSSSLILPGLEGRESGKLSSVPECLYCPPETGYVVGGQVPGPSESLG